MVRFVHYAVQMMQLGQKDDDDDVCRKLWVKIDQKKNLSMFLVETRKFKLSNGQTDNDNSVCSNHSHR